MVCNLLDKVRYGWSTHRRAAEPVTRAWDVDGLVHDVHGAAAGAWSRGAMSGCVVVAASTNARNRERCSAARRRRPASGRDRCARGRWRRRCSVHEVYAVVALRCRTAARGWYVSGPTPVPIGTVNGRCRTPASGGRELFRVSLDVMSWRARRVPHDAVLDRVDPTTEPRLRTVRFTSM